MGRDPPVGNPCYRKAIKVQEECFQPFFKYIFYIKIWHASSNNGINLFKIIVFNNRNYNLKGIIDNYDFCHNRAALISSVSSSISQRSQQCHTMRSDLPRNRSIEIIVI